MANSNPQPTGSGEGQATHQPSCATHSNADIIDIVARQSAPALTGPDSGWAERGHQLADQHRTGWLRAG